ncbi:MAG: CCA tRNA nucleotidyltransferase [Tumebacillaceae bacterium]
MNALEREAWQVVEMLETAGYEAYLVGGCVRDRLLGRELDDYDITTSALPEEVQALFPHTVPTGIKHGTVTVIMEIDRYQVTTFRTDGEYEDGRRPSDVTFVRNLVEDLARRDFTINAMALGRDGTLHDPFGGQADLQNGLIRAVGDPMKRFGEDALRMLRAIRFAAQLRFVIEERTLAAIYYEAQTLKQIAKERVREEWQKMLLSAPDVAIELLRKTDTLRYVLARPQTFDVRVSDPWGLGVDPWELAGLWAARAPVDFVLRFCMVLVAVQMEEARVEKTLQELKLSGETKREMRATRDLVAFGDPGKWGEQQWRQLFYRYGYKAVMRSCVLHATIHEPERIGEWVQAVKARQDVQPLWSTQDLALSGEDLMAAGLSGPAIGKALNKLVQAVLQEPERNTREALLALVQTWIEAGQL